MSGAAAGTGPAQAQAVAAILDAPAPRATGFIVTIYGDVAEPRGGTLWMGTLIETCAAHGISESLVRTAVSRLVGSGRLVGERIGRRSYYRLTDAARAEFAEAARLFYAPPPDATGWLLALGEAPLPSDLSRVAWARIGPEAALAPDRADVSRPAACAAVDGERLGDLRAFAARHWALDTVAEGYRGFLARFAPVADLPDADMPRDGAACLALRLRLVHAYRQVVLGDPRLPRAALPADWPGRAARRAFAGSYLRLAEAADMHVGRAFHDSAGPLAAETEGTRRRRETLARQRAEEENMAH
ncbi:PaaX family transcriptional regulator C-terminal domain-containing protein [Roseivivax isoporae]|uniref:PaaX family transcripitonal regulator n=1 Tax=Roseivivax isoporae LMG 25204 TaxID=1449351 RepID=X7FA42_9RHOB|nr:PaaX family transcriptional regulator C-terminal domain-containing protein [Roseivivax isoporae]ETX29787.1 PaaX family transcripitonal regulator [Roseivivax isoporae LMG 25204]